MRELNHAPSSLAVIEALAYDEAFHALVLQMREERRMKLDDSTLVRLVVEA